jgi:hypothetical protein
LAVLPFRVLDIVKIYSTKILKRKSFGPLFGRTVFFVWFPVSSIPIRLVIPA